MSDKDKMFFEETWLRFNPRRNIELVLSQIDDDLFTYQKQITFYALAAWVITGRTKTLTKNAICLGMIAAIVRAESDARRREASGAVLSMFVPALLQEKFYRLAYEPIGGMATLAKASSAKRHGEILRSSGQAMQYSLEIMQIMHLAYERWHQNKQYEVSVAKAVKIVSEISGLPGGRSDVQLQRHWRRFRKRISLLYAASCVHLPEGTTLLEEMCRHHPRFSHCVDYFEEWLTKANYVLRILETFPERSGDNAFTNVTSIHDDNCRFIPSGLGWTEFGVERQYLDGEIEKIEKILSRKRGRPTNANGNYVHSS